MKQLKQAYLLMYRALLKRDRVYRVYAKRIERLKAKFACAVEARSLAIQELTQERASMKSEISDVAR